MQFPDILYYKTRLKSWGLAPGSLRIHLKFRALARSAGLRAAVRVERVALNNWTDWTDRVCKSHWSFLGPTRDSEHPVWKWAISRPVWNGVTGSAVLQGGQVSWNISAKPKSVTKSWVGSLGDPTGLARRTCQPLRLIWVHSTVNPKENHRSRFVLVVQTSSLLEELARGPSFRCSLDLFWDLFQSICFRAWRLKVKLWG